MAKKLWIDPQGLEIPPSRVSKEEKARERTVDRVFKEVWKLRKSLIEGKALITDEIEQRLEDHARNAKLDGWKGNASITNFGNSLKIERSVNELLDFTEEISLAQQKIGECIRRWSDKANRNLRLVVDDAFKTDSKGKLNKKRILGLKRLEIDDETWKEAMQLIDDAIRIIDSRIYYTFHVKDAQGGWVSVSLNFSWLDPQEPMNPAAPDPDPDPQPQPQPEREAAHA